MVKMNPTNLTLSIASLLASSTLISLNAASLPEIEGLYLHLDAASLQAEDQDTITTWTDSINHFHFTGKAVYEADYSNGQPALRFDGKSDSLSSKDLSYGPKVSDLTLFIVGSFATATNDSKSDFLVSGQHPSGANNRLRILKGKGDGKLDAQVGNGRTISNITETDTAVHAFSLISGVNGNQVFFLKDGTIMKSSTFGDNPERLQGLFLGSYRGNSQYFEGTIAEVLLFERALTQKETAEVFLYLMRKYRIQP
jgi:hypothetical protein